MSHPLASMHRLAPRNGRGLACDEHGIALGPAVLVEKTAGPSPTYRRRPRAEIERALTVAYGQLVTSNLTRWHAGLDAAARALQAGDVARAGVIAVQLRLPDPTTAALAKLAADPALKKYSPDQPRDERGRWTTGQGTERPLQFAQNDMGSRTDATPGTTQRRGAVRVNLRGLGETYLDPEFAERLRTFDHLCQEHGITLEYESGYRTQGSQDQLHDDPTATTPAEQSLHSAGLAVDVRRNIWARLTASQRKVVVDAARQAGLSWGGNFRNPDPRHFYYNPGGDRQRLIDDFGQSVRELQSGR